LSYEIKTERTSVENQSNCEAISSTDLVGVQYVTSLAEDYKYAVTISSRQKSQTLIAVSTTINQGINSGTLKISYIKCRSFNQSNYAKWGEIIYYITYIGFCLGTRKYIH
jgi:hypothetical protein